MATPADPPRPIRVTKTKMLSQIMSITHTWALVTIVLLSAKTEAICYSKETLLPIRKPVGAELFEIDPGAEVTRNVYPHDRAQQTTCKLNMFLMDIDILKAICHH